MQENALKLKNNHLSGITYVCALIYVHEVGNSLWKAIKRRRITQEDAYEALETLDDLQISLYDLNWSEISADIEIAIKTNLTIYDAAYLYVSEKMSAK